MSAFLVNKTIIDRAMTLLMMEGDITTKEDANEWGRRAWHMNVDAVSQRYAHHAAEDAAGWAATRCEAEAYVFEARNESPEQLLKGLNCLMYQCSEGDVPERPFFKLLDALDDRPHLKKLRETDAYHEADWAAWE